MSILVYMAIYGILAMSPCCLLRRFALYIYGVILFTHLPGLSPAEQFHERGEILDPEEGATCGEDDEGIRRGYGRPS